MTCVPEGHNGIALPAMRREWGLTNSAAAVADVGIARCVKRLTRATKPARIICALPITTKPLSGCSGNRVVRFGRARIVENTSRGVKVARITGVAPVIRDALTDSRTAETTFGAVPCVGNNIRSRHYTAITAGIGTPGTVPFSHST